MRYPPRAPHKRGISAILARYPVKTRQNTCDTPSAILSRKGIARYGSVSRTGPLSFLSCQHRIAEIVPCKLQAFSGRTSLSQSSTSPHFWAASPCQLSSSCHYIRKAQSTRTAKFDPRTLSRKCSRKCTRECTRRPTKVEALSV